MDSGWALHVLGDAMEVEKLEAWPPRLAFLLTKGKEEFEVLKYLASLAKSLGSELRFMALKGLGPVVADALILIEKAKVPYRAEEVEVREVPEKSQDVDLLVLADVAEVEKKTARIIREVPKPVAIASSLKPFKTCFLWARDKPSPFTYWLVGLLARALTKGGGNVVVLRMVEVPLSVPISEAEEVFREEVKAFFHEVDGVSVRYGLNIMPLFSITQDAKSAFLSIVKEWKPDLLVTEARRREVNRLRKWLREVHPSFVIAVPK